MCKCDANFTSEFLYIRDILHAFGLCATSVVQLNAGKINSTFVVVCDGKRYILQRINSNVFHNPKQVAENTSELSDYYYSQSQQNDDRHFLKQRKTLLGECCYTDNDNGCWRLTDFIENTYSPCLLSDKKIIFDCGTLLCEFEKSFQNMPHDYLVPAITDFHSPNIRYNELITAYNHARTDRKMQITEIFAKLQKKHSVMYKICNWHLNDRMRLAHYDTKLGNILFDSESHKPLCLIDLDTACFGNVMYDYGDLARDLLISNHRETGIFDFAIANSLLSGYLSKTTDFLTDDEKTHIYDGLYLVTFELCTRFLTDFLNGEVYFKVQYEGQMADRAKELMNLLECEEVLPLNIYQ